MSSYPCLHSSDRKRLYQLDEVLPLDSFDFRAEGSAALLLIAMHLTDPRPWTTARNPVYFNKSPGLLDLETKRILGKRFRREEPEDKERESLDPFSLALNHAKQTAHDFYSEAILWPPAVKTPGKLLPRRLTARAFVKYEDLTLKLYSRNFSELSQCLHAELMLLIALSEWHAKQPKEIHSFQLHTTLKPCRMCAAFLHILKPKVRLFEVTYEENDPGPLAAHTLLDQFGYHFSTIH